MASALENLAQAIRAVGAETGPVRPALAAAANTGRKLIRQASTRNGTAAPVTVALRQAASAAAAAEAALASFAERSEAFADRLVTAGRSATGEVPNRPANDALYARYIPPTRADVDALDAAVQESGAGSPTGYVSEINPRYNDGREWQENCGPCSRAFANTFQGKRPEVAPGDRQGGELAEMYARTGVKPPRALTLPEDRKDYGDFTKHAYSTLEEATLGLPVGSALIVGVDWVRPDGARRGGHWFNAIVGRNGLEWVDAQSGKASRGWPPAYRNSIWKIDAIARKSGDSKWQGIDL